MWWNETKINLRDEEEEQKEKKTTTATNTATSKSHVQIDRCFAFHWIACVGQTALDLCAQPLRPRTPLGSSSSLSPPSPPGRGNRAHGMPAERTLNTGRRSQSSSPTACLPRDSASSHPLRLLFTSLRSNRARGTISFFLLFLRSRRTRSHFSFPPSFHAHTLTGHATAANLD